MYISYSWYIKSINFTIKSSIKAKYVLLTHKTLQILRRQCFAQSRMVIDLKISRGHLPPIGYHCTMFDVCTKILNKQHLIYWPTVMRWPTWASQIPPFLKIRNKTGKTVSIKWIHANLVFKILPCMYKFRVLWAV